MPSTVRDLERSLWELRSDLCFDRLQRFRDSLPSFIMRSASIRSGGNGHFAKAHFADPCQALQDLVLIDEGKSLGFPNDYLYLNKLCRTIEKWLGVSISICAAKHYEPTQSTIEAVDQNVIIRVPERLLQSKEPCDRLTLRFLVAYEIGHLVLGHALFFEEATEKGWFVLPKGFRQPNESKTDAFRRYCRQEAAAFAVVVLARYNSIFERRELPCSNARRFYRDRFQLAPAPVPNLELPLGEVNAIYSHLDSIWYVASSEERLERAVHKALKRVFPKFVRAPKQVRDLAREIRDGYRNIPNRNAA